MPVGSVKNARTARVEPFCSPRATPTPRAMPPITGALRTSTWAAPQGTASSPTQGFFLGMGHGRCLDLRPPRRPEITPSPRHTPVANPPPSREATGAEPGQFDDAERIRVKLGTHEEMLPLSYEPFPFVTMAWADGKPSWPSDEAARTAFADGLWFSKPPEGGFHEKPALDFQAAVPKSTLSAHARLEALHPKRPPYEGQQPKRDKQQTWQFFLHTLQFPLVLPPELQALALRRLKRSQTLVRDLFERFGATREQLDGPTDLTCGILGVEGQNYAPNAEHTAELPPRHSLPFAHWVSNVYDPRLRPGIRPGDEAAGADSASEPDTDGIGWHTDGGTVSDFEVTGDVEGLQVVVRRGGVRRVVWATPPPGYRVSLLGRTAAFALGAFGVTAPLHRVIPKEKRRTSFGMFVGPRLYELSGEDCLLPRLLANGEVERPGLTADQNLKNMLTDAYGRSAYDGKGGDQAPPKI